MAKNKDYRSNMTPAANVHGVKLKRFEYKTGTKNGRKWEGVDIAFNKGKQWLNDMIFNPSVSSYKNSDKYSSQSQAKKAWNNERRLTKFKIDSLGIAILGKETMADIQRQTSGQPFRSYIDTILDVFEENDFKKKKLCIKTLPMKDGDVKLPRYGAFVRADDDEDEFEYTEWEQDVYDNNYSKTKYAKFNNDKGGSAPRKEVEDLLGDGPGWSDDWDEDGDENDEWDEFDDTPDPPSDFEEDDADWVEAEEEEEEEDDESWENDLPFE